MAQERTVAVNGVDLYVVEDGPKGAGPPVILAHGFPSVVAVAVGVPTGVAAARSTACGR